jgi:hypothetical protein
MQKLTRMNLEVLALSFRSATRISNQISPAHVSHLRRCIKAGLIRVEGSQLVLTEAGQAALIAA